ncbi:MULTISPECIES: hypothetical protein [unclassified Brevundimonas]|uniref:hypothetical protein n=1 Tax=unclassified Brevundimonas TaxID=2622653 RepID=UPI0025B9C6F4|nr:MULTISPECIES: hypothetical protein [unclassified Brevundimonas]
MAFREKIAWLTLAGFALAYGYYFFIAGPAVGFGEGRLAAIPSAFAPAAVAHAIVMAVGAGALALAARRDANTKPDERDRAIDRRATSIAYGLMMVGVIIVGVVAPFSEPAFKIINASLALIVVCEAIRQVMIIVGYRRGFSG